MATETGGVISRSPSGVIFANKGVHYVLRGRFNLSTVSTQFSRGWQTKFMATSGEIIGHLYNVQHAKVTRTLDGHATLIGFKKRRSHSSSSGEWRALEGRQRPDRTDEEGRDVRSPPRSEKIPEEDEHENKFGEKGTRMEPAAAHDEHSRVDSIPGKL